MSRRERRSVSLGRHRDRAPRDTSRPIEEDLSTRHNISNFLLTLQRVQASEEENRQLRKENQLLRQRTRSSRLSSASLRHEGGTPRRSSSDEDRTSLVVPELEDKVLAAETKRNSLIFVGDTLPFSPEHAALETQHKRLQEDFDTLKEFLKHLFQHAVTLSTTPPELGMCKENKDKDINTYNPTHSKQLERNLEDIHGQISQLRNSQDQQQVKMEQVHQALDNVLSQSSVRNDVTMRLVRQQDKMKEMTGHVTYLETQLMDSAKSFRQAQEKLSQCGHLGQRISQCIAQNSKQMKGASKEELGRLTDKVSNLAQRSNSCSCKMAAVNRWLGHVTSASKRGETLAETRPPAEVVECMSRLERLVGSDWHRFGRILGLSVEALDDIGKFTNFDLTSRVEKVVSSWARSGHGVSADTLRQALEKMDRDLLLVAEAPLSKQWHQLPADVLNFSIAHLVDVQSLSAQLAGQGAIGPDTKDFIIGAPAEHRRAGRLLHTCVFMGLQALSGLCTALDSHRQAPVATKIRGCLPSCLNSANGSNSKQGEQSEDVWTPRSTINHHNNTLNNTPISRDTLNISHISSSSSSTASRSSTKSGEKERKKRSRSLFARKNKLRDTEVDVDSSFQEDSNYYYPAVNMNAHSQIRSSRCEDVRASDREDRQRPRQYGRKSTQYSSNSSREGVVV